MTDAIRQALETKDDRGVRNKEKIVNKLLALGLEGHYMALTYIIDRMDGKIAAAADPDETEGEGLEPNL